MNVVVFASDAKGLSSLNSLIIELGKNSNIKYYALVCPSTELKDPKIDAEKIHLFDEIGVINGLYATRIGTGGIVPIQIFKNYGVGNGNFTFKLTGSQGDVMKESVQCAFTAALDYIDKTRTYSNDIQETYRVFGIEAARQSIDYLY